jgi:pyruvate dehydrogenase E2 component (dihydrolipoamide acetyltransferase)
MAEFIRMPKLGFDMQEGTFAAWVKQIGDTIHSGDVIAEVETDKATVEVETYEAGVLLHVMAAPGDILQVGAPIAIVGAAGEDFSALLGATPQKAASAVAESLEGQTTELAAVSAEALPAEHGNGHTSGGFVKASPVARRLAAEKGIDLQSLRGSGPGGRVIKEDVLKSGGALVTARPDSPTVIAPKPPVSLPAGPQPATVAASVIGSAPSYRVMDIAHELIPTSRLRATIARRMVESKQFVPHFTVTMSMDTSALVALRAQINAKLDEAQKVTVNDFIVKAVALTLLHFPNLNTHYHGENLVRYHEINIGMAVALPNGGLMNVVAKQADKTSLSALAAKNKAMIAAAREGKVKPEDIEGSTFTVSNLGAFGVEHFTAIINPPEAGILAVGASQRIPVVTPDGQLGIGNVMKCTLSVDHRVSDGAEGADFMRMFKSFVEDPLRLLV